MIAFFAMLPFLVGVGPSVTPPQESQEAELGHPTPRIVVLDQVPGCYGSVTFDHRLHEGMSTIEGSCENCHHDARDGAAIQPCRECHALETTAVTSDKPGLRGAYHQQCLSCHKDWAHENACGFCHVDSTALAGKPSRVAKVPVALPEHATAQPTYVYRTTHKAMPIVTFHHTDHAERFGLKCADCHGGSDCGGCHGPKTSRAPVERTKDCYSCHSERRCVSCHQITEREPFEHTRCAGWLLRPGHTDLACAECHGAVRMPGKPDSSLCKGCHAKQSGGGAFDHGTSTGVELYGDHGLYECTACHAGANGRAMARCDSCHPKRPVAGKREVGRSSDLAGFGGAQPAASDAFSPATTTRRSNQTTMALRQH